MQVHMLTGEIERCGVYNVGDMKKKKRLIRAWRSPGTHVLVTHGGFLEIGGDLRDAVANNVQPRHAPDPRRVESRRATRLNVHEATMIGKS